VRKNTSSWSQEGELTIFNLPKRVNVEPSDAIICSYNNFVDPKEFTAKEVEDIGNLDIPDNFPGSVTG
jgi:hypothetical protein